VLFFKGDIRGVYDGRVSSYENFLNTERLGPQFFLSAAAKNVLSKNKFNQITNHQ
jgi:hypothetical protein